MQVKPPAISRSCGVRAAFAIRSPPNTNIANSRMTHPRPIRPNSSPMVAAIMSVWASGRYEIFCRPFPGPTPHQPPDPIAINAWTV